MTTRRGAFISGQVCEGNSLIGDEALVSGVRRLAGKDASHQEIAGEGR